MTILKKLQSIAKKNPAVIITESTQEESGLDYDGWLNGLSSNVHKILKENGIEIFKKETSIYKFYIFKWNGMIGKMRVFFESEAFLVDITTKRGISDKYFPIYLTTVFWENTTAAAGADIHNLRQIPIIKYPNW